MGDQLTALTDQYDRDDQSIKREVGRYLYERPAEWISKQQLADEFDKDESTIAHHINELDEEGFVLLTTIEGKRHVQWDGRGAGGFRYWSKAVVPRQLWQAGNELRPLLTLDRLGGAYLPTIVFGVLMVVGVVLGTVTMLIGYLDVSPFYGWTIPELLILTGYLTMAASLFLVTAVAWRGFVWVLTAVGVLEMLFGGTEGG